MSRRRTPRTHTARRTFTRRMSPVAHAALLALLLASGHEMATAGIRVSVAQPYAPIRARSYTVNTSGIKRPDSGALPVSDAPMKDANGNPVNIATTGDVRGVTSSSQLADGAILNTLSLTHYTKQAIVKFKSFDIGDHGAVNVNMLLPDSSGLYQIGNGTDPSKIFGSLTSNGTLYLINQNGILFGAGAQINVQGLFASTLRVDEADYLSDLNNSIQGRTPTFQWAGGNATYVPESAFVKVEQGAQITTGSGGRVFLLGGQVENAGTITSPNGQVVLASGSSVYLTNPAILGGAPLYMSEANSNVPTVKGLLVEVNGSQIDSEFATNSGQITTPTGNTTIVGWAVNQMGRINATTSVTQNGSVYLLARSGTTNPTDTNISFKHAAISGTLTMGPNSVIAIAPDTTSGPNGQALTAAANTLFTPSRVELAGQTIEMQRGAVIVAPGGTVNARASLTPVYSIDKTPDKGQSDAAFVTAGYDANGQAIQVPDTSGRILMQDGARIDVSGTTDTVVSVARNFVTTALLGAQDLKDAPVQKDGPIYRSTLTFDIRSGSPILSDTSSYINAVQKSADEFMSTGGKVTLSATGSVALSAGSNINVSGGAVNYTSAYVSPSILYGADGKRYTLNTAPADVEIVGILGKEKGETTRFGVVPAGNLVTVGVAQAGYTEGKAAGSLSVFAPVALMDGTLKGSVVAGARQQAGLDKLAVAGTLRLGTDTNTGTDVTMGKSSFLTAVLQDLQITQHASADTPDSVSRISADQINASGFGQLLFTADNSIEQQAGANLNLPALSTVKWQTNGQTTIGANIVSTGGSVTAATYDKDADAIGSRGVTVKAGSVVDVSGNWVNQRLDGAAVAAAVAGGNISLLSAHNLTIGSDVHLNVSGGVTVTSAGTFTGTDAGGIKMEGLNGTVLRAEDAVTVGSRVLLEGYGMSKGGTLRFKAGSITVRGGGNDLTQSGAADFTLGSGFFNQGGFQSFDLEGVHGLTIGSDVRIAPQVKTWQAKAKGLLAATGSAVSNYMQVDQRANIVRNPVNLTFSSLGAGLTDGLVKMETGARIDANALATVAFNASHTVDIDGTVRASGGAINATVTSDVLGNPDGNHIELGDHAVLDVSGGVLYTPTTNGLLWGKVYDGGTITLSDAVGKDGAYDSAIDIAKGAQLLADGGTGVLDVARTLGSFGPAYTRQTLASNGGSINVRAGSGGASLAGRMSARAGNGSAMGGTLNLALGADVANRVVGLNSEAYTMTLQHDKVEAGKPVANSMTVSTQAVAEGGFANVYLQSQDSIRFAGSDAAGENANQVSLGVTGHLRLDAAALSAANGTVVDLSAGSTLQLGSSVTKPDLVLASAKDRAEGTATLTASGGLVELFGTQTTQGFGEITLNSGSELRLRGVGENVARTTGAFNTNANITVNAQQVTATTATDYTIDTTQDITINPGKASAAVPLSAQATLTVKARKINQNGVIRLPFGQISFKATDTIKLGAGSVTSVSGEDLLVPYGATIGGGVTWQYNGQTVNGFLGKSITVDAAGETVVAEKGAQLNLDGGGNLQAWEFVSGPGGSKDIFSGAANGAFAIVPTISAYAPYDTSILNEGTTKLSLTPSSGNALSLGNTLTFGPGGMLPAGTYAILPARYALLPGAYLIQPNSSITNVGLGFVQKKPDGSQILAAVKGVAGVGVAGNEVASAYTVMTSAQARRYSEVRSTDLDTYLTNRAVTNGTALPALMGDAGRLSVIADKLTLDAQIQYDHASKYRGGQLDIASKSIYVGDSAQAGALNLTFAQLNATKAESILLGGVRRDAGDDGVSVVDMTAQQVTVDASYQKVLIDGVLVDKPVALSVGDIAFAATDTVEVKDGVHIEAPAAATKASSLSFTGDGALLRVSSDAAATTTRQYAENSIKGAKGDLKLGQNLTIAGGAITAEGTRSNQINIALASKGSGSIGGGISSHTLTVGASRIVVGDPGDVAHTDVPLVVDSSLAAQLNKAQDLTLRSYSTVDMMGISQLGSSTTRSLTVDGSAIQVLGDAAKATLTAGAVAITNTTGVTGTANAGNGTFTAEATGANGGTGHVTIGSGAVAISGANATTLNAAGSVVMKGNGSLTVPGDLNVNAQTLTATSAANAQLLVSNGSVNLNKRDGSVAVAMPGAGAALQIAARSAAVNGRTASVSQNGQIFLPSGKLTIAADHSVGFGAASTTDLSGLSKTLDGQALTTVGGDLFVTAKAGDITAAKGSVLNVSAALGKSSAGSMNFSAPGGQVSLQGNLLATSAAGQTGGSLSIDARDAVDIKALADRLSASLSSQTATGVSNFAKSIALRNRQGDQTVETGTQLSANNISLNVDAGKLTVKGSLYANGDSGGKVSLHTGTPDLATTNTDVVIDSGADIQAKALTNGGTGGSVVIGVEADNAYIRLNDGSIDTTGKGATNGRLALRAQQNGNDVNIAPIGTKLTGVNGVGVEAFAVVKGVTDFADADLGIYQDAAKTYLNTFGQGIANKIAASQSDAIRQLMALRAGLEVRSDGNLNINGLSVTDASAPLNLTLRAAQDINVNASISQGFSSAAPAGIALAGQSGDIHLIGGADMNAADVMATVSSNDVGDVNIGNIDGVTAVSVRTTTGDIAIAAGRDVVLRNSGATVYTTGTFVSAADASTYVKPPYFSNKTNLLMSAALETPFLTGGGGLTVQAQRDVKWMAEGTQQMVSNWWYRFKNTKASDQLSWWSRYDLFKQGFATFGGGDISIVAGQDLWHVNASAASSGYVNTATNSTVSYGGGSVALSAGHDIVGGEVLATVDTTVSAGHSVIASDSGLDPQSSTSNVLGSPLALWFGDGKTTVTARNDLLLGGVIEVGQKQAVTETTQTSSVLLGGSTNFFMSRPLGLATLDVAATGGDLTVKSVKELSVPGATSLTSATGDVTFFDLKDVVFGKGRTAIYQIPADRTDLSILASGNVALGDIYQYGMAQLPGTVVTTAYSNNEPEALSGAHSSTYIVAESGDVSFASTKLITPLDMIAGRDILQSSAESRLIIQHQDASDVSLIQAGRDFKFDASDQVFGVEIDGPGNLIVSTGRGLDLHTSNGIQAFGNLSNKALPVGSAGITVLSGVNFSVGDITDAVNAYYPLLGGTGVGAFPDWLYTQIEVGTKAGNDAAAAQAEAQANLASRNILDLARGLAGEQAYQEAVLGFVNHRLDAGQSSVQALEAFKSASSHDQALVAGQLLAKVWTATVPDAARREQALSLAQANSGTAQALIGFVAQRTGQDAANVSLKDALEAFSHMSVAQQTLLVTKTLSQEVAAAIVEASSKTGAERELAYTRAYDALSTVFPHATEQTATIDMGSSMIKTLQGSSLSVFNPNGGVNVGQLVGTTATTTTTDPTLPKYDRSVELGLVTANQGDLSVIVRDDVAVNTSRIFTLIKGDETIWASLGNVDAGRGAKTVTSTPAPVYFLDGSVLKIDASSAISGSGISSTGQAHIAAPKGEINAGDAGISATQGLDLAANVIRGTDNIASPVVHGAPPPPAVNLAAVANTPTQPTAAGPADDQSKEDNAKAKKRKRNVLLDFLGFGASDDDADKPNKQINCATNLSDPACRKP